MFLSRSENIDNCNEGTGKNIDNCNEGIGKNINNCNEGIGKNMYIRETIKVVLNSDNICYVCLHEDSISLSVI
jgi:hypothetical protein